MKQFSLSLLKCLLVGLGLQSAILAAPTNDSFSVPTVVTGLPATATGSNVDATLEVGEPLPNAAGSSVDLSEASVWFAWTAPTTGSVQIDTFGSDFDTVLTVWKGSDFGSLNQIAGNDEFGGPQSAVFLEVVVGVTYHIAVYGWRDSRGQVALNIENDSTSRISGIVTGPDGITPLSGVFVLAFRALAEDWEALTYATTDVDGNYTIYGLGSDTYRVQFDDFFAGDYIPEFYDDALDVASATDIMVATNTTVAGIDASLELASKITGTVTGPDGTTPLASISVFAYQFNSITNHWDFANAASTQADGRYQIGGLAGGTYRIGFETFGSSYSREFYNNAPDVNSATSIVVADSTTVPNINASLTLAPGITGSVTGPNGTTPLAGITVTAYRLFDSATSSWYPIQSATTAADGSYQLTNLQFSGLPSGPYRVGFSDPSGSYAREFYSNAVDVVSATSIVIAENTTASGIDASMTLASRITGTVTGPNGTTPLAGIEVRAYLPARSWETLSSAVTQADGSYQLGGLAAGTYQIGFSDPNGNYIAEYYNNVVSVFLATSITVGEAITVSGFNASLAVASKITGTVTGGADGTTPLEGIRVTVFQSPLSFFPLRFTSTKVDGSYQLGGLEGGTYQVEFRDVSGAYITEYYRDALDLFSATNVPVSVGTTVSRINASLVLPSSPKVMGFRKTGPTSFEMSFTGTPGNQYLLQQSTSLTTWENVGTPFTCQHGVNLRPISSSEPKMFWRVKTFP